MRNDNDRLEELRRRFRYEPETGRIISIRSGKSVGAIHDGGYVRIYALGGQLYAHRLAWALYYGAFPSRVIDHINGDRADNRIENLRDVSYIANALTARRETSPRSGFTGVVKYGNKWRAQISLGRRSQNLGHFSTAEQAHRAYLAARQAREAEHIPSEPEPERSRERAAFAPPPSPQLSLFP